MRLRVARVTAALLGLALAIAGDPRAASAATVAYASLPRLVASHPLHGVLAQYDAEISALRGTQSAVGLRDPAGAALHGATALQTESFDAAKRARAIGDREPAANRARERAAIAELIRAEHAAGSGFATDTMELSSETAANLRAYGGALAERTERAYAARAQQFRERESTLAYNLAERDAGQRLALHLKLEDLHLTAARRANLRGQLAALDAAELRAVEAQRGADAAWLGAYRAQLERDAATASQEMDQQLRSKSRANYTLLQRVFHEAGNGLGALPALSQLAAFSSGYAASSSAQKIASGMRGTGNDLAKRFRQLAAADVQSRRETDAQLHALEADRDALYRAIVAQIRAAALGVARERGLASVELVNATQSRGVDLTPAIRAQMEGTK